MALKIYNDFTQEILYSSKICRFFPTEIKAPAIQADSMSLKAKGSSGRGHPPGRPVLRASCGYAHSI